MEEREETQEEKVVKRWLIAIAVSALMFWCCTFYRFATAEPGTWNIVR